MTVLFQSTVQIYHCASQDHPHPTSLQTAYSNNIVTGAIINLVTPISNTNRSEALLEHGPYSKLDRSYPITRPGKMGQKRQNIFNYLICSNKTSCFVFSKVCNGLYLSEAFIS